MYADDPVQFQFTTFMEGSIMTKSKHDVDWRETPPFITAESGGDGVTYQVVVRVRDIHQLHAAHDVVLKGFSDWMSDRIAAEYIDAHQG